MDDQNERDIYLSRNNNGDHYVITIKPPIPKYVAKIACLELKDDFNFGGWFYYEGVSETRIKRHDGVEGDEGLRTAGLAVGEVLVRQGFTARMMNANAIARTESGNYERQSE